MRTAPIDKATMKFDADEDVMQSPDDNLDHYALGFYAPEKGLPREACPYAEGTQASARWLAGYDAAVRGDAAPAMRDEN